MSSKLIAVLMVINVAVSITALVEGNFWRSIYWLGAATINLAVINLK